MDRFCHTSQSFEWVHVPAFITRPSDAQRDFLPRICTGFTDEYKRWDEVANCWNVDPILKVSGYLFRNLRRRRCGKRRKP